MRILTTGVDPAGRSYLSEVREVGPEAVTEFRSAVAFPTTALPLAPRPPGDGSLMDLGVPPAHCRWSVVTFPPHWTAPMHHTDTVDFDTVLAGSMVLVLGDGEHELGPGDLVVVAGVDHAWRAGSAGATMTIVVQGTEPPAEA